MDRDTEIYRYLSFKRFHQMLFQKQIALVLPEKWDDEYEVFWLKSLHSEEGQQRCAEYLKQFGEDQQKIKDQIDCLSRVNLNHTYCLCFSQCRDEEVLWRANSDNKKGIMITTTCGNMEDLIRDSADSSPYIAKIQYDLVPSKTFDSFLKQFIVLSDNTVVNWDPFNFLLHKRSSFSYEKEVRVMCHYYKENSDGILPCRIPDLSSFICEVMAHPLAEDDYAEKIRSLCEHFKIHFAGRSKVYRFERLQED